MVLEATFSCAFCGETCFTVVDPSAGRSQEYVEDCHVCCRPNIIYCQLEEVDGRLEAYLQTEPESD